VNWTNDSETSGLVTLHASVLPPGGKAVRVERAFEITAALRRAGGTP
jgi:hypothetical protein